MISTQEAIQWLIVPYHAIACGYGLIALGIGVFGAFDDEKMTRENVEKHADRMRDINEGAAARMIEAADGFLREDTDEVVGPSSVFGDLAVGVATSVTITGGLLYIQPYLHDFFQWNLTFAKEHYPSTIIEHNIYQTYSEIVLTQPGYILAGVYLLGLAWLIYGRICVILLSEYL